MSMTDVSIELSNMGVSHQLVLASKDKWIQEVTEEMDEKGTEGALHRYFGIPEGEKIPTKLLKETLNDPKISEKTRKRIQFALNVR